MRAQFELIADCPECRVEGSVIELYVPDEPACALGVAAEAHCRMCAAAWDALVVPGPGAQGISKRSSGRCPCCGHALLDEEIEAHACGQCGSRARTQPTRRGETFSDRESLVRALARFAAEENEPDLALFLASNFMDRGVDEILAMMQRGERIETSFDAMFSLFHRGSGRSGGSGGHTVKAPERLAPKPAIAPRPAHDPRAIVLALVSVLMADGENHPAEQAFLDRFLAAEGQYPLTPDELKVHRPVEVSPRIPPARRAEVLETMTQLACVDGDADPSELRIVNAFAGAWGVPEAVIARWVERYRAHYATDAQRFLRRLKNFFVTEGADEGGEGDEAGNGAEATRPRDRKQG